MPVSFAAIALLGAVALYLITVLFSAVAIDLNPTARGRLERLAEALDLDPRKKSSLELVVLVNTGLMATLFLWAVRGFRR